ncbi:MAG: type III pantothenate kinase [Spirochaetales bacterium]|nr:type III pantothenate kinase [Candidatus Physcosoma equi]
MMILAIDVGNTTITYSGIERTGCDYQVNFAKHSDTVSDRSVSFYKNEVLRNLKKVGFGIADFEGAIFSSVVPSVNIGFTDALRLLFKKEPVIVSSDLDTGLMMDVENPKKVGNDRIADAAWVASRYSLPAVTVDMGTATTFNVIGTGGVFMGGAISAGLETSLWALSRRAAQLPEVRQMTPEFSIGKNTVECMEVGSVLGAACMIDGLVDRFEQELGMKVTLVITGGLARTVEALCHHDHIYDPDLLAKGMGYLYDRNKV